MTARMSLILFWAEVEEEEEEEEDDNENSVFPALMKMEEEESSLFLGLMKMEDENYVFSGVMARNQGRKCDLLCWEMVSDHLWAAKIRRGPYHHPKTTGDQA